MKVYDYKIDGPTHCREGVATDGRSGILLDTFWTGGDRHRLTAVESATAEERFDTDDFRELDGNKHGIKAEWSTFAPKDRQVITSQHRLQCLYFVRNGATPDLATQIENARQKVADAVSTERSAASSLQRARDELLALENSQIANTANVA
jgi:hypothetical protein